MGPTRIPELCTLVVCCTLELAFHRGKFSMRLTLSTFARRVLPLPSRPAHEACAVACRPRSMALRVGSSTSTKLVWAAREGGRTDAAGIVS